MSDWAVLDRTDPAPGDPDGTRALGGRLLSEAQRTDDATGRLRSVAAGGGELKMAGDYAAGYQEALDALPVDLDKLGQAFRGCGNALNAFAGTLAEAKTRAGTALRQGVDADQRYRAAMGEMRNLLPGPQQVVLGSGLSLSETTVDIATIGLDEGVREQVRQAARRARQADQDLDQARDLADQAAALRESAEDRCVEDIDAALVNNGIKDKAWYEKAWDFVAAPFQSWDAFIDLVSKVALVAGVAALFISGPLGWALMAAALVGGALVFGNDLAKFSRGEIGLGGLAFSALGLIPGGRGIVSITKLGRSLTGVGRALTTPGGGRVLLGMVRSGAGAVGQQVRNIGTAVPFAIKTVGGIRPALSNPRLFARAMQSRFLGRDPIDLVTGEMVMQMTDFELPGLLPLVLERTYSSAYGVGRWFGPSWSSLLDQRLEVDAQGVCFAYTEAILLSYPSLAPGESALPEEGPRVRLTRTRDGGYVVEDPTSGRRMWFAPVDEDLLAGAGVVLPLASIGDRNGNRIDLGYDSADGSLAEIRHTGGYVVDVETQGGAIVEFRLQGRDGRPDTSLVRYRYDERGRLTEVINSSGLPLRFAYDSDNRIVSWMDRIGTWYRYSYDNAGRVVRTSGSAHCLDGELRYDPENRVTVEVNSLGAETAYHFNDAWQVQRVIDPLGHQTLHEWDRYDRKLVETDALGHTTRFGYDEDGNLTEVIRPDGLSSRAEYNELGLPTLISRPDDGQWRQEFDERGNLVARTDPTEATTRYRYAERGALRSVTDPTGRTTRIGSDAAGLPIAVTDPLGATTALERDDFGRIVTLTDPLGNVTRTDWTVEGKPSAQVLPDGATQSWRYDGEGSLVEHVDALGQTTTIKPTYFDLPSVRIRPDGSRLAFSYDTELRLTAVTDPRGLVWRYEYDLGGRLVREIDYDGRVLSYQYDAVGRLIKRVNGAGQMLELDRDPVGNVVRRRSGSGTVTLSYDTAGRLVRGVNADAEVVLERDHVGRIVAETINGRTLTSSYDTSGRRTARRTPSGVESRWEHDDAGRPAALHTAGRVLAFGYDVAGREVSRQLNEVATLTQGWNPASQLVSQTLLGSATAQASAEVLQQRTFSYRADGYVSAIDDRLHGRRSYDLDRSGQITAVTGSDGSERYAYDRAGNVVDADWPAAEPDAATGYREFAGSRVRRAGNVRYDYDAQGRVTLRRQKLLSGGSRTWRYDWDAEDRLTAVVTPDGAHWRYRYDVFGRRIAKERLGPDGDVVERTTFSWDGPLPAEETRTSAGEATITTTTWEWQPGGAEPLAQYQRSVAVNAPAADAPQEWIDEQFYAIVTDLVGTPTEFVTEAGDVIANGPVPLWAGGSPDSPCPLRFPGQYHDEETGLHYNLFRHYDPTSGTYTSCDPLGLGGGQNPTRYSSNPLYWTDPLGLAPYGGGSASGAGASGAAAETARLEARAGELQGALDPLAQNRRTAAALGTHEGTDVLAGGGRDLNPAQRALAGEGDVLARSPGAHAEVTAVKGAQGVGLTPQGIAASRPFCPDCVNFLEGTGATIMSPTTAWWF
jgi:RHS repeat-associated protein